MEPFFVMLLKPFITLGFLLLVWLIAKALWRLIPDGKVKRALYSPLPWYRGNRADRGLSISAEKDGRSR